jgi:hypothetical protein
MKRAAIVAAVALLALWGWLSAFAWFDPVRLCRIDIDVELLEGDRGPIRAAIALVRREDPLAYHALCRWVDRIQEERHCDAGDPKADPRLRGQSSVAVSDPVLLRARAAPGCYVRGSRVVVLRQAPGGSAHAALVRERADVLKRLAGYAEEFWLGEVR